MPFELLYTPEAFEQYEALENDPHGAGTFKQVKKALSYLAVNPRHKSLNTHKHYLKSIQYGFEVFEAYAQHNTPGAYRIFFYYSAKGQITIIAITPHP